jgi:hypothetical protein
MTEENDQLADWTAEDERWLQSVPMELRNTAKEHGKVIFQLTMQQGILDVAFSKLARMLQGNAAADKALRVISTCLADLTARILVTDGKTGADVIRCSRDIELVAQLMDGGQEGKRSPSGIILNS